MVPTRQSQRRSLWESIETRWHVLSHFLLLGRSFTLIMVRITNGIIPLLATQLWSLMFLYMRNSFSDPVATHTFKFNHDPQYNNNLPDDGIKFHYYFKFELVSRSNLDDFMDRHGREFGPVRSSTLTNVAHVVLHSHNNSSCRSSYRSYCWRAVS